MTVLLVFAAAIFALVASYRAFAPLVLTGTRIQSGALDTELRELEELTARRDVLLKSLRELEFERETNKVSQGDFETFRARYEREALDILKEIDRLHGGRGWQERIDEELRSRVGPPSLASAVAPSLDDSEQGPPECVSCGAELQVDDRFCSKCGTPVVFQDDSPADDSEGKDSEE